MESEELIGKSGFYCLSILYKHFEAFFVHQQFQPSTVPIALVLYRFMNYHHHHEYSAFRQVRGTHSLQASLFCALCFISLYKFIFSVGFPTFLPLDSASFSIPLFSVLSKSEGQELYGESDASSYRFCLLASVSPYDHLTFCSWFSRFFPSDLGQ